MKKLLLVFFSVASFASANAQSFYAGNMYPQYTDITPDHLVYYTYFPYTHFDFDMDIFPSAGNDVEITSDGSSSPGGSSAYINIKSLSPDVYISFGRLDSVFDSTSTSWLVTKVAKPLAYGELINSGATIWDNSMQYIVDHSASFGWTKNVNDWIGGDRYVGLKYVSGPNSWYGWIRLNCFKQDSCYVKDFSSAMNTVGIVETASEYPAIYPNPSKEIFYIDNLDLNFFRQENISLTDLSGRKVNFSSEKIGTRVIIKPESVSAGCYLLKYADERCTFARTLVVVNN
ncbi:MAG: T9SS type A sorting domain-containing protein [Bacteroidia bacterium]